MLDELKHLNCIRHQTLPIERDLHLLLDGALLEVAQFAYEHDDEPQVEPLYLGTRHASAMAVSPCLIKPSDHSRLLEMADHWRSSGVLIRSEAPMHMLAGHLRSLISARLPSGQFAYMRYYSPEWLLRLVSSFTPGEVSSFSGPVDAWIVATEDGWLEVQPERGGACREAAEEGWLSLNAALLRQWEGEERERFLERMAIHFDCAAVHEMDGQEQRERLSSLIAAAGGLGFAHEHLCIHYLELAWAFPDRIAAPPIAPMLADISMDTAARLRRAEEQLFGLGREA